MADTAAQQFAGLPISTVPVDCEDPRRWVVEEMYYSRAGYKTFMAQFDANCDVDFIDLWISFEELLEEIYEGNQVFLSFWSPEFLVLKFEDEKHKRVNDSLLVAMGQAIRAAGLQDGVLRTRKEFNARASVADAAIIDKSENPLVWCEIADNESYSTVLRKMMYTSASIPSIVKFVIVCFFPSKGEKVRYYNPDFLVEFQVFGRLTDANRVEDDSFSTLHIGASSRGFQIPKQEYRRLHQNYDLVLESRRAFEFTPSAEAPIFQLIGDDSVLPMRIVSGDDIDVTLNIDMSPVLYTLQTHRDQFASRAFYNPFNPSPNRSRKDESMKEAQQRLDPVLVHKNVEVVKKERNAEVEERLRMVDKFMAL